jgi:hypothetical protein
LTGGGVWQSFILLLLLFACRDVCGCYTIDEQVAGVNLHPLECNDLLAKDRWVWLLPCISNR